MQYPAAANQIAVEGRSEASSAQSLAQLGGGLFAVKVSSEAA